MKIYKFYSDAGHGWLAVKIKELMQLGIITHISQYSYMNGATAYLEEDCDASLFLDAYREKNNCDPKYEYKHINGNSAIRSYDRYNTNRAIDVALVEIRRNK